MIDFELLPALYSFLAYWHDNVVCLSVCLWLCTVVKR